MPFYPVTRALHLTPYILSSIPLPICNPKSTIPLGRRSQYAFPLPHFHFRLHSLPNSITLLPAHGCAPQALSCFVNIHGLHLCREGLFFSVIFRLHSIPNSSFPGPDRLDGEHTLHHINTINLDESSLNQLSRTRAGRFPNSTIPMLLAPGSRVH